MDIKSTISVLEACVVKAARKADSAVYDSSSVKLLKGLESIRLRPGMYIGGTGSDGLHHILYEIIDNSVDEYQAGECTRVRVHIDTAKNVATVEDNGRGIPVDIHPDTKEPTLVSILTKMHMGGKFGGAGPGAYSISGGLHGIGAKATCALSDRMTAWSTRNRKVHKVVFSAGKVIEPLTVTQTDVPKDKTGTRIQFHPDPEIFGKLKLDPDVVRARLKNSSYMCPGLKILLRIDDEVEDLTNTAGLAGMLKDIQEAGGEESVFDEPLIFHHDINHKEGMDVALWWTDGDDETWYSFVNRITVPDGGTHVMGAKGAVARELRHYCDSKSVTGDDLRDGLRVAIHMKLLNPQFEGQTKNRLNNPECQAATDRAFGEALKAFLGKNRDITKKLIARAVEMSKARLNFKASRKLATQTSYAKDPNSRRGLPVKLATAMGCTVMERELFLVEGDSAGGSAKAGRNSKTQEILPLRGKILNIVKEGDLVKIGNFFDNEEIDNIVRSIGAGHDVTVPGESCDPKRARQGKVILLMDADADGGHIACLLIGFFLRFMMPLVEDGRIWVAHPPLYVAKWGSGRVYGDSAEEVQEGARIKGIKNFQMSRFKGLAEMNPAQLAETSLHPGRRRITRLSGDKSSLKEVSELMGSDANARKVLLGLSS